MGFQELKEKARAGGPQIENDHWRYNGPHWGPNERKHSAYHANYNGAAVMSTFDWKMHAFSNHDYWRFTRHWKGFDDHIFEVRAPSPLIVCLGMHDCYCKYCDLYQYHCDGARYFITALQQLYSGPAVLSTPYKDRLQDSPCRNKCALDFANCMVKISNEPNFPKRFKVVDRRNTFTDGSHCIDLVHGTPARVATTICLAKHGIEAAIAKNRQPE